MNTGLFPVLVALTLAASCGGQLAPAGEGAPTDAGAVGAREASGGSLSGGSSGAAGSSGSSGSGTGSSGAGSDGGSGSVSDGSSGTETDSGSSSSSENDSGVGGGDGGNWIDITTNPNGCENQPGTPCGWAATDNGFGFVCTCYNGTDSVPWGCEPPGSCVTPGPSCPPSAAPICDAGTSSGGDDAGTQGSGDGGGWIYMGNNPNACEGNLGDPCGWTTTNEGQGYTCQTTSFGTACEPSPDPCSACSRRADGSQLRLP